MAEEDGYTGRAEAEELELERELDSTTGVEEGPIVEEEVEKTALELETESVDTLTELVSQQETYERQKRIAEPVQDFIQSTRNPPSSAENSAMMLNAIASFVTAPIAWLGGGAVAGPEGATIGMVSTVVGQNVGGVYVIAKTGRMMDEAKNELEEIEERMSQFRVLDESYTGSLSNLLESTDNVYMDDLYGLNRGEVAAAAYREIVSDTQEDYAWRRQDLEEINGDQFYEAYEHHGDELLEEIYGENTAERLKELDEDEPIQHMLYVAETDSPVLDDYVYTLTVLVDGEPLTIFSGSNEDAQQYRQLGTSVNEFLADHPDYFEDESAASRLKFWD